MDYYLLKIAHVVAAVVAVGPLALSPWLSSQIVGGGEGAPTLLRALQVADTFYNRAGWFLILTGAAMFYLSDWHRALHPWFLLCVGLFVVDGIAEQRIREPAIAALKGLSEHNPEWRHEALRLRRGAMAQTASASLILALMLIRLP